MRSVGRKLTPITEVARKFDGDLVSRPDIREAKVVPEIQRFYSPMMELQVGISAPLDIEASDPLDRPLWYKFFSRFGDVFLEKSIWFIGRCQPGRRK